jgi:hypothetical protein
MDLAFPFTLSNVDVTIAQCQGSQASLRRIPVPVRKVICDMSSLKQIRKGYNPRQAYNMYYSVRVRVRVRVRVQYSTYRTDHLENVAWLVRTPDFRTRDILTSGR